MVARFALRTLRRIEDAGSVCAAVAVFAVMALGVAEIVARGVFNAPIAGHVDIVVILMPFIVFLGISRCLRGDGHIRMTLVIAMLPGRLRALLESLGCALGAFTSAALAYGAYQNFERAWAFNDNTPDLKLLTWPVKLAVAVCLALLAIRFLVFAVGHARQLLGYTPGTASDLLPECSESFVAGDPKPGGTADLGERTRV